MCCFICRCSCRQTCNKLLIFVDYGMFAYLVYLIYGVQISCLNVVELQMIIHYYFSSCISVPDLIQWWFTYCICLFRLRHAWHQNFDQSKQGIWQKRITWTTDANPISSHTRTSNRKVFGKTNIWYLYKGRHQKKKQDISWHRAKRWVGSCLKTKFLLH